MSIAASLLLWRAVAWEGIRAQPGRTLLSVLGIAAGVALALAVSLINTTAVDEFTRAVQRLSGDAALVVRGSPAGFPESLYARLAGDPAVEVASPGLEFDASLPGHRDSLPVLALDAFQAARLRQPGLGGTTAEDRYALLEPDAVLLSEAAARWLGVSAGGTVRVQSGLAVRQLRVVALLPGDVGGRLAVMDIAGAQWLFDRLGVVNRIDLRLKAGTRVDQVRARLERILPPGVHLQTPEETGKRSAAVSRAYRVNLGALSLVALLTGGFLVYSAMAASIAQRRRQLALLCVLGLTRPGLVLALLAEGLAVGLAGALPGVALGWLAAKGALAVLGGGDLGGGYFAGVGPALEADPVLLAGFGLLGVAAAVAGAVAPALNAARQPPAQSLKGVAGETAEPRSRAAWGAALLLAGVAACFAPPVADLPLFGYAGVALMLTGAIALMPRLLAAVARGLPVPAAVPARVALLELRDNAGQASLAVAAIVASFGLMAAMTIMVASFRQSVDDWLAHMLRADVYLWAAQTGGSGGFGLAEQQAIARVPGVARAEPLRFQPMLLDPARPEATLIARPVMALGAAKVLRLAGPDLLPPPGAPPPVWISEALRDVYGWRIGSSIDLPLAGRRQPFVVAGIWRDYARQGGSLVMDVDVYRRLTGDTWANDVAVWLAPGADAQAVVDGVRARLPADSRFDVRLPAEIRRMSLSLFDRSFAVTYLLEAVAVVVGLLGVSSNFASRVLARRAEFGMLRHVGFTRRQVGRMLTAEAALVGTVGVAAGLALGFAVSVVLVKVVNPQSFHWSMDLHVPGGALAVFAGLLLAGAVAAAAGSGRRAAGTDVIRAVREE